MKRKKRSKEEEASFGYNLKDQFYRGIRLKLIPYHPTHYASKKAKRYELGESQYGQNVWIPNKYLKDDGTIQEWANLDFVMREAILQRKFMKAYLDASIFGFGPYYGQTREQIYEEGLKRLGIDNPG